MSPLLPLRRSQRWIFGAALFLIIWGLKLVLIDRYGSDLPGWDQLPREGELTYIPWVQHHLFWSRLIDPHNEHRIAPTIALNLGLLLWGGQWDARVQLWVNAALHAAMGAIFFLWLARQVSRGWALAAGGLLIVIVAQPIAFENLLTGFQSQFYFLILFSLFALHGLMTAPLSSFRWWTAVVSGGVSLVSMGSGLLFVMPLLLHGVFDLVRHDRDRRRGWANIGVAFALGAIGWSLHTGVPSYHRQFLVKSAAQFIYYSARCLAWPLPDHPWLGWVFWLPWLIAVVVGLKAIWRERDPQFEFVLAAGVWVLLQIAAVTYSRANAGGPAIRYGDIFAVGIVIGFTVLAFAARGRPDARWLKLAGMAHGGCAIVCLAIAMRFAFAQQLPERKEVMLNFERTARAFVLSDDISVLEKEPPEHLAYPDAGWLAQLLRRPEIRRVLPSSVAPPLPIPGLGGGGEPPTPPLGRATRTLVGPGEWRSSPLGPAAGWWKIETAGDLGNAGPTLELVAVSDGRRIASIAPSRIAGHGWRAAYVRAPHEPARLIARVPDAKQWFAFSEPISMSTLSYFSWQLIRHGTWFALAGGVFALGGVLSLICRPRPSRS